MNTFSMSVIGTDRAVNVTSNLVRRFQWFELTPLPLDNYEVKVKEENVGLLQELVTAVYYNDPVQPNEGKETCSYCNGNCPNELDESTNLCDGFAGDIDGLYENTED